MKYQALAFEVLASLRGPCVKTPGKNRGFSISRTARAVWLINSLLDGKNENIPNIHR